VDLRTLKILAVVAPENTRTTPGYDSISPTNTCTDGTPADCINCMTFKPTICNGDAEDKAKLAFDAMTMALELGHSVGLFHENQRFDAPQYLDMDIENIKDHDDVAMHVAGILAAQEPVFDGVT
jgi:hypothetical protein